ncbi:unnamed protein product [Blepharisma stoltei]|uniref:FGFR1 oncogene partner (FOP) N-terminal dimerisation domain-containing protein n=1 Tax=Blepharisma stoltei TaxID=1481888 RepID=A0AAU9JYR6_9CILI|nr:unnamed protein product [Blepharisma stoltei]
MEELKEIIIRTLDSAGVLDKIRAQLRLNVFKAVQNDEGKIHIDKSKAISAAQTPEGKLAAYLFRDFMECYKMKFSLNVFVPECHLLSIDDIRSYLQNELKITPPSDVPYLTFMIQTMMAKPEPKPAPKLEPKPEQKLNPLPAALEPQKQPAPKGNLAPLSKQPLPNIPPLNSQKLGKFSSPPAEPSPKSDSPPPSKPAPVSKPLQNIPPFKNQKPTNFIAPEIDSESGSEPELKGPEKKPSNYPPFNQQKGKFIPPEIDSGSMSDSPREEDWKKKPNKFDSVDEEKKRLQDIDKRIQEINKGDDIKKLIEIEGDSPQMSYEEDYEDPGSEEYYEERYSEDEIYDSVMIEDYDVREPVELVQFD